jgi:hypothetical protein
MFLPLSGDAVVSQSLTDKLKARKKQKNNVSDLILECFENRVPKRKLPVTSNTRFMGSATVNNLCMNRQDIRFMRLDSLYISDSRQT